MTESCHEDHKRNPGKEFFKALLIRALFHYSIAGGRRHVTYLLRLRFPRSRIGYFYDVVDNGFYQEACDVARQSPAMRQLLRLPDDYFLYVGRLAQEKNVGGLLAAFAAYRRQGGKWSLVLVGDGPDRHSLEACCVSLGIREHVYFAGLKNSRELIPYFAFGNCLILPSTREPWGLVVNEAMASGLPVIVSNRCGCADDLVRDEENGFIFDPFKDGELTKRMVTLSASRDRMEAMGKRSREIIFHYSPTNWAIEVARLVLA